ncbi:type I restriction endonuclease subunit R [Methylovulum psychrotolerans]|uniref:type I restriction endonuclease subunit R n=1 Tax=Methylovulum psychrotolerans TaxID=1704499 RepID=UPI0032ECDD77
MNKKHTEIKFEDALEHQLLSPEGGFERGIAAQFDKTRAMDTVLLIGFIKATQATHWQALQAIHGERVEKVILDDLEKEINGKGLLNVLRHGFKCFGRTLHIAYFTPNNRMNPQTLADYRHNRLTITRQLHYSAKDPQKSLDTVLSLNGLPVVTLELKNPMSGQTAFQAIHQYQHDRDPRELLFAFKKRALVHFAVDPDLAFMTTQLAGPKTFFLPFNLGHNNGAGNPPASNGGYKTAYLWDEVLQRDSLLDILGRFMHLQELEKKVVTAKAIKTERKESLIFPRYHQLDVVRQLVADTQNKGAGHNYLIQHSAGSGKSNSIAWLAHRLSVLHDADDQKIFASVIVVTDRLVLDQQLQKTIYQFEHKQGVVKKIEEDTRQLVNALATNTPIIVTTQQKFPFVAETLEKINKDRENGLQLAIDTRGKRFAVIVDEAHSSQSGDNVAELKHVLNKSGIQEAIPVYQAERGTDESEEVIEAMLKRGRQPNLSFFAFTATPKYKTKKLFDAPGKTGEPPFHLYAMRQAIEEGFILDVLKNYIHYEAYAKLVQTCEDDPLVKRRRTAKELARFLGLHPTNIEQKTEVMVEHFRTHVRHKIGGKAKAMVVTQSRLHAVRYKQAFDKYIKDKGYADIKSLVAFSGTVDDPKLPDRHYTEVGMNNGIKEKELPDKFDSDDYQVLLVAEKYQTGFDQPLLHTMYVDKLLSGIQAVQTLSRLNRTCAGKENTFILDFVNKAEDIFISFKPYYENTPVDPLVDPHHLYELQDNLIEVSVFFATEVHEFAAIYFKPRLKETVHDHGKMNGVLDLAVERFKELPDAQQDDFKGKCVSFRNLYSFLAQIIPYQDSDLEKLYIYLRFLLKKLPRRKAEEAFPVEDEVNLSYYRLQKISEGQIDLTPKEAKPLKGPNDVGTGKADEDVPLSQLIDLLNERFGTEFTPADQLFFDQLSKEALQDTQLQQAAHVNTIDDFKYLFDKAFEGLVIDRMEGNADIFNKLMGDDDFRTLVTDNLLHQVYNAFKANISQTNNPSKQ